MTSQTLVFNNTEFNIIDQGGAPWLRANQIATALGYSGEKAIHVIYSRHADEFTEAMTGVFSLKTPQGEQPVRIFSMRGAHLIAMFSRVPVAKEFRKWVLDILERETQAPPKTPYSIQQGQTLTAEEAETLRLMLQTAVQQLPKDKQGRAMMEGWSKLKSHFKVGYRQIPQERYSEALSLLARHITDWADKAQAPSPAHPLQATLFDQDTLQNIAGLNGILQQRLMQEILLPLMTGSVSAGQRWVLTLAPDDLGHACIPLLHRLGADAIISRALEMPAGQQRSLRLLWKRQQLSAKKLSSCDSFWLESVTTFAARCGA